MFGFLARTRLHSPKRHTRRAALTLEALEARYCLNGSLDASTITLQDVWSGLAPNPTPFGPNQPPVVSNFGGSEGVGNLWTFAGQVSDPDDPVVGDTVHMYGGNLPSLNGKTTTVDSTGWFHISVVMGAHENGTAGAMATDPHGANSNMAMCNVHQT